MSKLRGEDIIIGIAAQERATPAPAPQVCVPGRTPTGILPVTESVAIRGTGGSKVESEGIEITSQHAEGDFEFNLRYESIGYILKSLLGAISSQARLAPNAAVYDHTFGILPNDPEHPVLTFFISQGGDKKDYKYPLSLVSSVKLEFTPKDLIKTTLTALCSAETELPAGTVDVSFADTDEFLRHQDITIKVASTVAGLADAPALKTKNMKVEIPNGGRTDQNVGELNPGNMLAGTFKMKGSFESDYIDESLHDIYTTGAYVALQITMARADVTIGSNAHPGLVITFPRVSFAKWSQSRPLDDVARDVVDFAVHYDKDTSEAISAVLTNTITDYDAEAGS